MSVLIMMMCTSERKGLMVSEREALVACSDKSMKIGVNVWDINSGNNFLHIPSCASPPFGLLCLRNRYLVASQLNRHGSVGGGSILVWSLNKPLRPLVNYTIEAIGPLSCTKDGLYLAGGGLSGNIYIWDVTSGKLLKSWTAHNKSLNCMLFSDDNSLLISGSDDGMICVWSMISLLDVEESRSLPSLLHCLLGHKSSITGLLTLPGSCSSVLVTSSLDGTCKVWDIVSGKLMQSQVYSLPITSIALDYGDEFLFYGIANGTIIVNKLDIEGPITFGQTFELKGHSEAITALTSSQAGLISGSKDCTICIWNVMNRTITRRFNLEKGKVTNLVVIMRSWMLSKSNHNKVSKQYIISPLHKCPEPYNLFKGATTLVSLCGLYKENQSSIDLRSATLLTHHTPCPQGQKAEMSMAMSTQMKVETNIEHRMWAIEMTKHVMKINKQLKSQLLGMIQNRLCCSNINNPRKTSIKKLKIESLVQENEGKKP